MAIKNILKPKTQSELEQIISDVLVQTPTLIEFVMDHEIFKYHRVLKAYHYIADIIKTPPEELYVIYADNLFYKIVKPSINNYNNRNQPIQNIKFVGGPFSYALIKKNSRAAELYGGYLPAIIIGLDHLIDIINTNNNMLFN